MREEMSGAGDYVHFKAHVPLHRIQVSVHLCPPLRNCCYGH
jgi:hypothetical protein